MASSTKTENYQLNQYGANDQPTWVGDYSGDMLKIDTALGNSTKRTGDKFSEAKTYAVGNLCIKDDLLYKFTAAKEAGAWDETKVKATTIEAEFEQLNGDIAGLTENMPLFDIFSETYTSYTSGDRIVQVPKSNFKKITSTNSIIGVFAYAGVEYDLKAYWDSDYVKLLIKKTNEINNIRVNIIVMFY